MANQEETVEKVCPDPTCGLRIKFHLYPGRDPAPQHPDHYGEKCRYASDEEVSGEFTALSCPNISALLATIKAERSGNKK